MALHEEKVELLRRVDLFSQLREYELDVIAQYSELVPLKKGQPIFSHGSPARELYIVEKGRVGIIGIESEDVTIAQLLPAESFGELDFIGGTGRTATAFAEEDSMVLRFPAERFSLEEIIRDNAYISARLLHRLLGIISERIWHVRKMLFEKTGWLHDLRKQLHRDKMTGLFNQTFLNEDFVNLLPGLGGNAALLMIKPDNFKVINDTCGHKAGDHVLNLMAIFLQSELGENDIGVRYRGDEFAAIMMNAGRDAAVKKAREIARTYDGMDLERILGTRDIKVRVSIGISLYPADADNSAELVDIAHGRMRKARNAGGNRVII